MGHKQKLEKLNKKSLRRFDKYLESKGMLKDEEHKKVLTAKEEWQVAWNKLMQTLLVLERLEI